MTDADPLQPIDALGDVFDNALDQMLRSAQDRLIGSVGVASAGMGRVLPDDALSGFHGVEWQLLHVANIATIINLARRLIGAYPDRMIEIAGEAGQLIHWQTRLASQPPEFMGSHFIPRIGMHPDADEVWATMMSTMLARRMDEDDGVEN